MPPTVDELRENIPRLAVSCTIPGRANPGDRIECRRGYAAGRRAANAMLYSAQDSMGACIMDAYLIVALICSIYLAGRIAVHRGRSLSLGVDRRVYRAACSAIDISVPELARQERRPRL